VVSIHERIAPAFMRSLISSFKAESIVSFGKGSFVINDAGIANPHF